MRDYFRNHVCDRFLATVSSFYLLGAVFGSSTVSERLVNILFCGVCASLFTVSTSTKPFSACNRHVFFANSYVVADRSVFVRPLVVVVLVLLARGFLTVSPRFCLGFLCKQFVLVLF